VLILQVKVGDCLPIDPEEGHAPVLRHSHRPAPGPEQSRSRADGDWV